MSDEDGRAADSAHDVAECGGGDGGTIVGGGASAQFIKDYQGAGRGLSQYLGGSCPRKGCSNIEQRVREDDTEREQGEQGKQGGQDGMHDVVTW